MVTEPATVIVMIGPPGSGKGTQSGKLSTHLMIPKISTGDILRQVAASDTPNSEMIREIMANGSLVPDSVLADLIASRLSRSDCENGFILDGYPRNISQATFLEELLSIRKHNFLVFEIVVPEDILLKRITGRFSCKDCGAIYNKYFLNPKRSGTCDNCGGTQFSYRSDDSELIIRERLKEYVVQTVPLIDYYRTKGVLTSIDGNKSSSDVYSNLVSQVSRRINKIN